MYQSPLVYILYPTLFQLYLWRGEIFRSLGGRKGNTRPCRNAAFDRFFSHWEENELIRSSQAFKTPQPFTFVAFWDLWLGGRVVNLWSSLLFIWFLWLPFSAIARTKVVVQALSFVFLFSHELLGFRRGRSLLQGKHFSASCFVQLNSRYLSHEYHWEGP